MITNGISETDIDQLASIFTDLDFTDAERRAVLLEKNSRDVQAAPGSGKTTLLAAKLLLLAQKWVHTNRGICVLSHTNVARDEIANRLSMTALGSRLLSYPHFVGTIHAFVNQFLALPLLRSEGRSIDVIDDDIFSAKALAALAHKYTLNAWVKNNPYQGPGAICTLRYEGPELVLGWEEGNLPSVGTPSHTQAQKLKDELAERGIFRFEDMFAYAARLLKKIPVVTAHASHRFPVVLIDEMQDTSWAQEDLLAAVFDTSVVIQRYGDRNQRILTSEKAAEKLTFPREGCLHVSTTKRFPEQIAAVVRTVQEHGEPVNAVTLDGSLPPVLLLYDTDAATLVIEYFGQLVLRTIPDDILKKGAVKAICSRKQCDATQAAGRHLGDYWPAYTNATTASKGEEMIFHLLSDKPEMGVLPTNLYERTRNVKRAILLCLRSVECEAIKGLRDSKFIIRHLELAGFDIGPLKTLTHRLVVSKGLTIDADARSSTIDLLFKGLRTYIPTDYTLETFRTLKQFSPLNFTNGLDPLASECVVKFSGRSVRVIIGTTAKAKGETHIATLVLESYGGKSKKFDLQTALKDMSGVRPAKKPTSETLKGQYRNLYVAMSRPEHLLCLAMNNTRAIQADIEALQSKGWLVERVIAPSMNEADSPPVS